MKKTIVVYDDTRTPERMIRNITGNKSFGDTIYKRVSLCDRTGKIVLKQQSCAAFLTREQAEDYTGPDAPVLKIYSDNVIGNEEAFRILAQKTLYAKECYRVESESGVAAVVYPDLAAYAASTQDQEAAYAKIESDAFFSIASADAFRRFITSGFDARYFNELTGDAYTVIKHSENVDKLRREYKFYGLLPEEMQMWFAKPFSYKEEGTRASYTMERYHMTDLAIRYVHGAITTEEFLEIMEKLFCFIASRKKKEVSAEMYRACARALYVDKVRELIKMLTEHPAYAKLDALIAAGTKYAGIADLCEKYVALYERLTEKKQFENVLVIGHGDLCFSNILYSHEASFLKLIDPKGADTEDELYTNPYYDLAKLSHSVCGSYGYFNSDLFSVVVEESMELGVTVDCDNAEYIAIFRDYLQKYGLDYRLIRLYEASLFLSMLPLHIDRERKVLGFICNAIAIMEEVEHG